MNKANTFNFHGFVLKAEVAMITLIVYISKEGGLYQFSLNVNLDVMSHFDNHEKVYYNMSNALLTVLTYFVDVKSHKEPCTNIKKNQTSEYAI